ncbi:MAG: SufD family Fe-S cluster assembly protein [Candidatus Micrarchaeota archaeon]
MPRKKPHAQTQPPDVPGRPAGAKNPQADQARSIGKISSSLSDYHQMVKNPPNFAYKVDEKGLSEKVIREISGSKGEPDWMLAKRLLSFRIFNSKPMPTWGPDLSGLNLADIVHYVRPEGHSTRSWEEVPDYIHKTFERLGVPQAERSFLAGVSAQYDSEVLYHNIQKELENQGVIFLGMDQAVKECPELVKPYFMTQCVPPGDNKFSSLHGAVWSGGSFVHVPKGVKVERPLQIYFIMNYPNYGQFEHTLIIAEEGSKVQYIEGCLPVGEEVSCGEGFVQIQEIRAGDEVVNSDGERAIVKKTMVRAYKGELIRLCPVSSGNEFRLTPEHPVLTVKRARVLRTKRKVGRMDDADSGKLKRAEPVFVPASELEQGDFVVFPISQAVKDHAKFTVPLLRGLGYYLAEGSTFKINNCDAVVLSFNDGERKTIEDAKKAIFDTIGKIPSEFHSSEKHELRLTVYSKELAELCKKHCGQHADKKRLSREIMELPPEKQLYMLKAYYLGDGSIMARENGNCVRALTVSRTLAFQLQEMLARQGIYACINIRQPFSEKMKDGKVIRHKTKYMIYYQDSKRFNAVKKQAGRFLVPLRRVGREYYDGNVHNLEVSEEPNAYLAKGFAVHNCTAPHYSGASLHSAVVEIFAKKDSRVRYTSVQNWSKNVFNLNTKRAMVYSNATMEWIGGTLGSGTTMLYPGSVLVGEGARADHLTIALAGEGQVKDTGAKVTCRAPNTHANVISKSISHSGGIARYRGFVRVDPGCHGCSVHVRCDGLILDGKSGSDTIPRMEVEENDAKVGHEAVVGRISAEQLTYLRSRGISEEEATRLIVAGFIEPVVKELPLEYAVEINRLIEMEMEGL